MYVTWRAQPQLPGPISDRLTVTDATFQVNHLQIVGDAGVASRSRYLLSWAAAGQPQVEEFTQAPVGKYSRVAIDLSVNPGDAPYALEIHGTWRGENGPAKPFWIHDTQSMNISFDCDETVSAAGIAELSIKVGLRDALTNIDFRDLPVNNGVLELGGGGGGGGGEMSMFRARLQRSFSVDDLREAMGGGDPAGRAGGAAGNAPRRIDGNNH